MFGAMVLGKEKAEEARKKQSDGMGGGAVQFGVAVLGKKEPKAPVALAPDVPAQVPEAKVVKVKAFTEKQAEKTLLTDPNLWDLVLTAEAARPEYDSIGCRPVVARALVAAADLAKAKPMPGPVLEQLRVMSKEA